MNYHDELKQRQETFEQTVDDLKSKLPEAEAAKVSDALVQIKTLGKSYNNDLGEMYDKSEQIKQDNEQIMLQNGKLLQRIETQDRDLESEHSEEFEQEERAKVSLDDIIDKNGKFKK